MEYSTHVFLQQTPLTDQNFESKLQDISDEITKNGCINSNVFSPFTNLAVQQAVVSSRHLAFLLQDGRICRLAFRIQTEKIESTPPEPTKPKPKHLSRSYSRQSMHRPNFENLVLSSTSVNPNPNGQIDFLSGYPLNRQRHHVIRTPRGRTGIILGSRPLVPASSVPEELIEQVQVVLQGKSRNLVLRELQRTNLDVNMAVNNLLARDDDGDDDLDDEYVGADLISLLDVNPHNDHPGIILESEFFDEADFALRYSHIQRRVVSGRMTNHSSTTDPPLERDRKRHRYDPRWLDGSLREELFGRIDRELKPDDLSLVKDSNSSIRKGQINHYQHQHSAPAAITHSSSTQNPILFADQLQFWTDSENAYLHFTQIACLYSELIAVNTAGQLCQWNWQDEYPYQDQENSQIKHPKTLTLKLLNEKILHLSADLIRASVLTDTNRLATWIDESLGPQVPLKLQHSLQEFSSAHILDIQTSPLYTIFRTENNDLYWYGVLPHKPRKKLLERLKEKARQKHRTNSQQQTITIGCSVCLISNPYYNQGAWAFFIRDGQPKLGQLMEQAWILSNTARFRIKTVEFAVNKIKDEDKSSLEMPPPPSPASSTCSIDSNPTMKRRKPSANGANLFLPTINDGDSNEQHSKIKDEEYWPLDEVIFLEDYKVAPVGKVMKIDGSLVLVKFPSKTNENNEGNNDPNNLENCRILRKDDLQVLKGNQTLKTPDCTLSFASAKRITLDNGTLLTYSVDKDYLYTLQCRDAIIYHIIYEIGSNNGSSRSIRQNSLPLINNRQSFSSFLGENLRSTSLTIPRIVIDGNQLTYPLIFNQDQTNFKDPQWKNLFPMNYFSQGIIPIKSNENISNSTHLILNIMQMKKGILIPHILRYDIEKIRSILNENLSDELVQSILDERIDGYRNLLHACVHIVIPLTNKEYSINDEQLANDATNKRISFAMDLLQSPTDPDHNYGDSTRVTTTTTEQPIHTWPPPLLSNDSAVPIDPQSTEGSTVNSYRSISADSGAVSPSYVAATLSSKIQYLQNQVFQQQQANNTSSSQTSQFGPVPSTRPNHFTVWPACQYDEREKRFRAIKILRLILDSPLLQEHLLSLLSARNLEGQTPFMSAVNSRAYQSALILFEYAVKMSKQESSLLESSSYLLLQMIYPSTNCDSSPFFTICSNDTCSFTWTGEEHINQAIFECRTCGLSGTLCCCSECAQTCHKGHDCRLKRTSPTAYCDCWEVCKCKSLIAGDQQKRLELLKLLLKETNLVEMKNARCGPILLFLVRTVARQIVEQQQFARTSTTAILQQQARKTREQLATVTGVKKVTNTMDIESTIPDHHLEPPQFCRRALELILADWSGVKSMLLYGCPDDFDPTMIDTKQATFDPSTSPPSMSIYTNEDIFPIEEQQQTSQLDRFTYLLLGKCSTHKQPIDLLDILLNTLFREISSPVHASLARYVAARFVRSVIRLFLIVHMQSPPDKTSPTIKSSTLTGAQSILSQCKRVFQTLTSISIDALVRMADLLLAPVRYGVAKPTAMFNLVSTHTDVLQSLDEIFNIDSEYSRCPPDVIETDLEEDDNHSDVQSQPEINHSLVNERQTTVREPLPTSLSDNESEMELELLAESDSDNESNHSAPDINTHRTLVTTDSENMPIFSDDENSDSDDADSVRSDSVLGEGDETSQPEPMAFDEARDALATAAAASTTTTTTAGTTDRLTTTSSTSSNPASQSNVPRLPPRIAMTSSIFGDIQSRRHIPPIGTTSSSLNHPTSTPVVQQQTNLISVNSTNSLLARAFGILIRQITDLLIRWPSASSDSGHLNEQTTINTLQNEIEQCLLPTWQWFATVMDSFESQIRFGMTLSNLNHHEHDTTFHGNRFLKTLIDQSQIETKKKSTTNRTNPIPFNDKSTNAQLDSLNYSLSLMRAVHEHGDQQPLIDVLSCKHLAYLLDAFVYYFRENGLREMSLRNKPASSWRETNDEVAETIASNNTFFQRSPSTLCLSSLGPNPFQMTIDHSLPLACRPQLLQPICRKEDLFGRFLYDQTAARCSQLPSQLSLSNRQRSIPEFLQPNYLNLSNQTNKEGVAVNVLLDLSAGLMTTNKNEFTFHSILLHGSYEYLLARWKFLIELFVKLFLDDVGSEPGSIINESSGFSAHEQRFRHDMERLKNAHQKDIRFEAMERDRTSLIQKTFRTLNSYFHNNNFSSSIPPLAVQRVKVTFKDEPGEGSGVARSFYTTIVEAILSEEKLPTLELSAHSVSSVTSSQAQRHPRSSRERRAALTYYRTDRRSSSMPLSSEARPFKLNLSSSNESTTEPSIIEHWTPTKIKVGLSLYPKISAIQPLHAEKITGMFLEGLSSTQLQRIINSEEELKTKIDEAMNILTPPNEIPVIVNERLVTNQHLSEHTPLFWQPDKKGVYAPRPGKHTPERLTAYRNIGRLIGLCLLQNELFPLPLCRHVIKYILNRSIRWHDLAFFDATMYESLRRMVSDAEKNGGQYVNDLHLTFSMTVTEKEGSETHDLIPDGSSKDVTYSNLYEFLKRYSEFRMIHLVEQSLQHLRLGVFDVLPSTAFDYLSPEDFRLLLNGTSNINVTTLMTYTTFNDESGETPERINQFKKWFWSVLEKFDPIERQDLVYFWTGSPALPASEAGFQPQPSVTIRPADDQHLPTANTCISRLYVPLYSSKTILKFKLQYAIKTKMFGFV